MLYWEQDKNRIYHGDVLEESHRLDRNFVGIELSKTYLDEIAVPRMENATRQLKLFMVG